MTALHWLPDDAQWRARLKALRMEPPATPALIWAEAVRLANVRLDFVRTNALDQTLRGLLVAPPSEGLVAKPVRLALLGTCTMAHLHAAIRVAGLRRGIWIDIYENDYGQYMQELANADSALHKFKPSFVLLAPDGRYLSAGVSPQLGAAEADAALSGQLERIGEAWRLAQASFKCQIIQQTPLPVQPDLLGLNEHRLSGSPAALIDAFNAQLRPMADAAGIDLLALDRRVAQDGLSAWYDASLWHRAKQEIALAAAPLYGEMVARPIAARLGRSAKCLVLDLDNTLWGGVIGDEGMEGIAIGQGSPLGEAYSEFQLYVRNLSRRGIILAVCSKNDASNALEPFEKHPDMTLRRSDIACFVANWSDKASNIRVIAETLNIGLDSLVFIDDNPVERALVRQELPMVAVPEVSDDPVGFIRALADAGYFESVTITDDDRIRASQYQKNQAREQLRASTTDMVSYLRGLDMQLIWRAFDKIGLQRTVQLINKTNQFNLTTRRYSEQEVLDVMQASDAFGLQLRLTDRFGDNGIISICIGRMLNGEDLLIDTWLMSCRVLGREVEPTTLNLIADQARALGAKRLLGDYIPSAKNAMVRDHYARLGFTTSETTRGGRIRAILELGSFVPSPTFITLTQG